MSLGIYSKEKIDVDYFLSDRDRIEYDFGYGYGPEAQQSVKNLGILVLKIIADHIEHEYESGKKIDDIKFESMIGDNEIKEKIESEMESLINRSRYLSRHPDYVKMFLESSATKFAFRSLKQKDWIKKWGSFISSAGSFTKYPDGREEKKILRRDSTKENGLEAMARILFGRNMISANGPDYLRKILADKSELRRPEYDKMGILFNVENLRTLPLLLFEGEDGSWTTHDLGIANKVPVKNFVAIVVTDDVKELPIEVLEIIPKNLPIITTNFRVIRIPEGEKTEKVEVK